MVQIIDEYREPSFGEKLGAGLGGALGSLGEEFSKKLQEKKHLASMQSYADQLLKDNPDNPQIANMTNLLKSDLPYEKKMDLLKNMPDRNPFAARQQARLEAEMHIKYFNTKIKELQEQMKNVPFFKEDDRDILKNEIETLQSHRDSVAKSFGISSDFDNDLEHPEDDLDKTKIPFNPQNKDHEKKARSLYKKFLKNFKNDENKALEAVRKALKKEFLFPDEQ